MKALEVSGNVTWLRDHISILVGGGGGTDIDGFDDEPASAVFHRFWTRYGTESDSKDQTK
ncbi:hypothetical protein BWQ96_00857 [Gracilariopsis chorda]|uniref:Uncharacterized protein n=1 Tax=Gracilariopsis chorda TaxID=448386 RepID=A0A2V3J4P8_9FLOR|nr:hypothetical protein BWQ96_00857 [Gracilariopsis chorda]|eukprot:PXF49283.1 hypothetical protein BWQ96_00857 [Gracilariopsis chorda]